jgi:D-aminopeptidase
MIVTQTLSARLDRAIAELPTAYPGPGGAVAVVHRGEVLVRHAWGFANAELRIPFTPRSLFRMCSITKQFTCATLLDLFPDPAVLDGDVREQLPLVQGETPGAAHLAHNQSGLRDYWAIAMLLGAPAESPFGDHESDTVIRATRSLQFAPGTRFSYSNNNFRILSDSLERRTGQSFADLLRTRIFDRVGMETAFLAADTRAMPDGSEGYEGSVAAGFRPAENRILWTGDAGLGASLDDMIAWERYIDATRDAADSLYGRIAAPVSFADGTTAAYGHGLARGVDRGRAFTAHGGALRGWRSNRIHLPGERLSVVVMLNHLSHAHLAMASVVDAVLGLEPASAPVDVPRPDWLGAWREPETGLALRAELAAPGQVRVQFGHSPEVLALQPDGSAGSPGMRLVPDGAGLRLERPGDNLRASLQRLPEAGGNRGLDVAGIYACAELEARLTLADAGGALYGAFSGPLGRGRMEQLTQVAADVWALPCPRALDHTPPGDWTLAIRRDGQGRPEAITLGCWLARNLDYRRVS